MKKGPGSRPNVARGSTTRTGLLILSLVLVACQKTEECRRLESMKAQLQRDVRRLTARAKLRDVLTQSSSSVQDAARAELDALGLDSPTDAITKLLRERSQHFGASVEVLDPSGKSDAPQVLWRMTLPARNLSVLLPMVDTVATSPPLTHVWRLRNSARGWWSLTLMQAHLPRVPIDARPRAIPAPADPAVIPSDFGFCGAGALRRDIERLRRAYLRVAADAAATAASFSAEASWKGVRRRMVALVRREQAVRKIWADVLTVVIREDLDFRGIGSEDDAVIVDLFGGAAAEEALLKGLPASTRAVARKSARPGAPRPKTPEVGMVRVLFKNPVVEQALPLRTHSVLGLGLPPLQGREGRPVQSSPDSLSAGRHASDQGGD